MTRTRSEYRLRPLRSTARPPSPATRRPVDDDRSRLALLLLDAYRGSVDDEGEGLDEALSAIDHYRDIIDREHSFVAEQADELTAMCFVVLVDDVHYVDPIAVASAHKRQGLGRGLVMAVLRSLEQAGVVEVGATITDGNIASERLFTGLGFSRVGAWS